MSLRFRQKTSIDAGPDKGGGVITKDFTYVDTTEFADCDEAMYQRLKLGPNDYLSLQFNSIDVAQGLIFKFNQQAKVHFINEDGNATVSIIANANRLSILHCQLRGFYIENLSVNDLEGFVYVIGN